MGVHLLPAEKACRPPGGHPDQGQAQRGLLPGGFGAAHALLHRGREGHPAAHLHPAGQRPEIFPTRGEAGPEAGKAGAGRAAHRVQHHRPAHGAGQAVPPLRPLLPHRPVPQQPDRGLRPGAVHRPEHRAGPQGKNPGGEPRRDQPVCGGHPAGITFFVFLSTIRVDTLS